MPFAFGPLADRRTSPEDVNLLLSAVWFLLNTFVRVSPLMVWAVYCTMLVINCFLAIKWLQARYWCVAVLPILIVLQVVLLLQQAPPALPELATTVKANWAAMKLLCG
tara:strand:- start:2325 stop:2648 length:324 start_codon:yes stop_codon:yes gene_type:complete